MSTLVITSNMASEGGKKRKRPALGGKDELKKKKKKVTIKEDESTAAATIKVSSVVKPQFAAPVIATTPGLCIPESVEFDSYARTDSKANKRARAPSPSAEMLLHAAGHRTVNFTGKEDKAVTDAPLQHYIGIFDPATGQLQVVGAKKMEIRGTVRARDASEEQMMGAPLRKTNMALKNDLGQMFGTKKAKKAILSMTENAIGSRKRNADGTYETAEMGAGDRVLIETMEEATSQMATREELQAVVDKAKPLPKGNYDAEEIQDVYVPDQIVGAEVLAAIPVRDWQEKARAGEAINVLSRFVANRVVAVANREDSLDLLRLLRYTYWLILYWQTARPGRERGTKRQLPREKLREQIDGAPEIVIENIRQRFTENGTIRKFHTDLIMTHCCAFACILNNFQLDTVDLREDLRLEQKQMSQYFSEIGARVKSVKTDDSVRYVAKLALPLRFPNSMRKRNR